MSSRHVTESVFGAQMARLENWIGKIDDQLSAHEQWHRDMLLKASDTSSSRRLAIWAVVIAAIAAAAAIITAAAGIH